MESISNPDLNVIPLVIRDKTIKGLHYQAVKNIRETGYNFTDERGEQIQELYNMMLVLEGVGCDLPTDPLRKRFYIDFAEGLISPITAWMKDEQFEYSYGAQMRKNNMLAKCVQKLRACPATRRTWIPILHPDQVGSTLEIPCCIGYDLKIRHRKLLMTTVFRSNDMYGAADSDIYGYRKLQQYLAWLLRVDIGAYHQLSISAHLRMSDLNGINRMLEVTA